MKRKTQHRSVMGFVPPAIVLCILLLGAAGTVALAAEPTAEQTIIAAQDRPTTVFDPFALRTVLVSNVGALRQGGNPPGTAVAISRRAIRIPYRPPLRSAFRPGSY